MTSLTALWLKDLHVLRNLRRILQRESVFKVVFILTFALGMMGGFFLLFLDGFRFLSDMGGGSYMITRRLFALFFFGLGSMLVMSNIVTSYSTLFRSKETAFLLTGPLDIRSLITYKFIESTLLSSWAFVFLIVPFAGAYAWHEQLGVTFALWTALFSIPFVMLCGGIGSLLAMVAVRWLPRNRLFWWSVVAAALIFLGLTLRQHRPELRDEASFVLNRLLPGLQLASYPLSPNSWVAEGIMSLTGGQLARGTLLWCTLVANMLVIGLLVQWLGTATFHTAYQRIVGSADARRRPAELLARLDRFLAFLPPDIRGMVLKDMRSFLRDPMQWSQALIFFGLLAIYFAGFRSFRYDQLPDVWRNLIVFLNIFSVSSVICSLASRFVFPQLSLEGHSFWILGLAPTGMGRILATKFLLAALAMVTVSAGLMSLATWMLQVGPALKLVAVGVAVAIAVSVSALATGLGAVFVDLKQPNPVAVISGFGGTVNLVLSLSLMLASILPYAVTWHWRMTGRIGATQFIHGNVAATAWLLVLTLATTLLPLWLGSRSLKRREY
jgi:ABC-2 type transport system permease protein